MPLGFDIAPAQEASSAIHSSSSSSTGAPCAAKITGIRASGKVEHQDLGPAFAEECQILLRADGGAVAFAQDGAIDRHRSARHVNPRLPPPPELSLCSSAPSRT